MNGAHLHLITNHLPIIIPVAGLVILLSGIIFKSDLLKRAAFGLFILSALTAIVAMNTGEEAEEIVEHIAGIEEYYIEEHEENAETFAILLYVLGGLSLLGFWANLKKMSMTSIATYAVTAFTLVVLFFGFQTGKSGGEIRHTEIRDAASSNKADSYIEEEENEDEEEDDDDD